MAVCSAGEYRNTGSFRPWPGKISELVGMLTFSLASAANASFDLLQVLSTAIDYVVVISNNLKQLEP